MTSRVLVVLKYPVQVLGPGVVLSLKVEKGVSETCIRFTTRQRHS